MIGRDLEFYHWQSTATTHSTVLSAFTIEGKGQVQLEVSKIKDVYFSSKLARPRGFKSSAWTTVNYLCSSYSAFSFVLSVMYGQQLSAASRKLVEV
jgi:hypothetical protein